MNYPKVINQYPNSAGKPYRPSNGTEGMMFTESFCDCCIHDRNQYCEILGLTMIYDTKDPEYPKEWIYNEEGWPICTKWHKWDGNEPTESKPIEPDDPNQLCMNFYLPDIIEELQEA